MKVERAPETKNRARNSVYFKETRSWRDPGSLEVHREPRRHDKKREERVSVVPSPLTYFERVEKEVRFNTAS